MISQLCWHDLYLLTSVKPCSTGLLDLLLTHNSVSITDSIDDSIAVRMNVTDTLIATGTVVLADSQPLHISAISAINPVYLNWLQVVKASSAVASTLFS